jgi:hypothetical protein
MEALLQAITPLKLPADPETVNVPLYAGYMGDPPSGTVSPTARLWVHDVQL